MHQKLNLFLICVCLLTACRSSEQVSPTAQPPPPVQSQIKPTTAVVEPSSIIIDNARLETFKHSSEQFSISYPTDWLVAEQPNGAVFVDPTNQALYSVFFSQSDSIATPAQLRQVGLDFIGENAANGFEIVEQNAGQIQFKTVDPTLGAMTSELAVTQEGDWVYFRLLTVPESQWPRLSLLMRNLLASLNVLRTSVSDLQTETIESTPQPPTWTIYGHPKERFTFIYPNDWQLAETDTTARAFWPETQISFLVTVADSPTAGQDLAILETFAEAHVGQLAEKFDQFEARPLERYQAGQASGYTQDYLYADQAGTAIAESIIVTGIDDKLYLITISAPALSYESALAWFNPMLQSFQLLPDEIQTP